MRSRGALISCSPWCYEVAYNYVVVGSAPLPPACVTLTIYLDKTSHILGAGPSLLRDFNPTVRAALDPVNEVA